MIRRPFCYSVLALFAVSLAFESVELSAQAVSSPGGSDQRLPRILGGEETNEYPAVGMVGNIDDGGFCTGTLISPRHVLTAGHCAEFIGADDQGTFQVNGTVYMTDRLFIHPDYDPFTLANDIAILQLSESVSGVDPSPIFRGQPLIGDVLVIVGFGGAGSAGDGSDGTFGTKRFGLVTVDEVTESLIGWTFDDESEANTASGDSGGPGYIAVDGVESIASVTSGGTEPDSILGDVTFNSRVDAYAEWIDSVSSSDPDSGEGPGGEIPDGDDSGGEDLGDEGPGDGDPPTDQEPSCVDFLAQPFPFLQLLIQFLNALLEELMGGSPDPSAV